MIGKPLKPLGERVEQQKQGAGRQQNSIPQTANPVLAASLQKRGRGVGAIALAVGEAKSQREPLAGTGRLCQLVVSRLDYRGGR